MTDKKLLQDARDALKELDKDFRGVMDHHWPGDSQKCLSLVTSRTMITRLDAELAKVAEPVVLDLSEVDWIRAHRRQYFNGPDLLAAIRAQLPGIEVRV